MATIKWYGIIAVRYNGVDKHPHFITHAFMVPITESGIQLPGKEYPKDEVIKIEKSTPVYTLRWDYNKARWVTGAKVSKEETDTGTFLRTIADKEETDNLQNLPEIKYFK